MDDRGFGLALRELRRRLGWRQRDVALKAGVRQQEVSDVERGRLADKRVGIVRRIAAVLDVGAPFEPRYRGGLIDRLLDRRHADLVERVAAVLIAAGWEVRPEVSFAIAAERGSIDLLAWNRASGAVLIIEVKTELMSVEETLRRLDVKQRLAPRVVRDLLGWTPSVVGVALVLPEDSTARRRVAEHGTTFGSRFRAGGREIRTWLREPTSAITAVWFLSATPMVGLKRKGTTPHRIRRPNPPSNDRQDR